MSDVPRMTEVADLYPFLYRQPTDPGDVLAEVTRAAREKAAGITELRRAVVAGHAAGIAACAAAMAERFAAGGRLFAFGNGGSSTDADALAATFLHPPPGARVLPAQSLTRDSAVVTALANDVGFESVFTRQLAAVGRPGDIAVGLTTSGGSANVVRALGEAARRGLLTVALAGHGGGRLAGLDVLDHLFVIPSASVHRIQEAQTTVRHVLWECVQRVLGEGR
ncbi:Phosphoheptose isomerase [Streptomyces sp. RB5]|uniref:Phosphoheptose isomerase n=1 Tax=Streptomyces smaragdinus TaxID=2585196 RepID=A0A7K0CBH8_9ACTN|nr:SIS domain-containing protein [Streptomyces smaragdinus]MQY10134.1 Phosphoheptose isomerase [Streptomyces smaragdinus]